MKHDDITIVLQGPLNTRGGSMARGVYNIPTYLQFVGAAIISTWENSNIKPSKRFLKNNNTTYIEDDPKKYSKMVNWMNMNLQIASSLNGLKKVKTKYAIKVRCDEKYEDLSVFIDTMKKNPHLLTTQEPFYRHTQKRHWISDHVMGGLTTKMAEMFELAYDRCYNHEVPMEPGSEYAPEHLLRDCFDGDNVWVSIEDFGDFVFKIQSDRITRSMLRKMKEIAPDKKKEF